MENFSAVPQADINQTTLSHQCHAIFNSFKSDDRTHDSANTTAHRNHFISFPKYKKLMTTSLSTIWENNNGCAEQYRGASELYLM